MMAGTAAKKISIGAIVRFAYRSVFGRIALILDIGWMPLLPLLAALILPGLLAPARGGADGLEIGPIDFAVALVVMLSLSAFAVRWHQALLVGDPRRLPAAAFFRAWLRFVAYMIAIYVAIAAILVAAMAALSQMSLGETALALVELAAILLGIAIGLAVLRFGLLFPAAAAGKPLGPIEAWRLMRGNAWRLAVASFATALPATFVTGLVTGIVIVITLPRGVEIGMAPPFGFVILAGLLEAAADIVLVALGASLLAACYREIVARRDVNGTANP